MNEINRTYYRITYTLESPLSVGSGLNDNTDMDILRDGRGIPYIPATSIAGVLRHGLISLDNSGESAKILFPDLLQGGNSPVIIYNAELVSGSTVSVRDSVKLDNDTKVAEDGAKFDFEIVETGAVFVGYIELSDIAAGHKAVIEDLLQKLNNGELRFGRKTTRGYGQVSLSIKKQTFSDIQSWLKFDMFDKTSWDNIPENEDILKHDDKQTNENITHIVLSLKMKGGISIREYTTELPNGVGDTAPDYKSLTLHQKDGCPVIPGTSWAGAFRSRFIELLGENGKSLVDSTFGYVNQKKGTTQKSRVTFSESMISGATPKLITRNSIDRFSGGTNDGALYTELTYFGGNTTLEITISDLVDEKSKAAIVATIADLHNGFLAIGGLTAVGRGLFEITKYELNGEDITGKFTVFAEKGGAAYGLY